MAANYDNSAWFYDKLSRLVYGKALINAQIYLLAFVPPGAKVLIAGGGTGFILEELNRIQPGGLTITYAEISANMLNRARKRKTDNNRVTFVNQPVEQITFPAQFDVIITPFLFDNFTEETFEKVFDQLDRNLKTGGLILNSSFQITGKWWQHVLLKTMFIFFKLICNIEATRLPDMKKRFGMFSYQLTAQKTFFGEFVVSTVYQKL